MLDLECGLLILSPERFGSSLILYLNAYLNNWYTLENPICVWEMDWGGFLYFFNSMVVNGRTGVCNFLPYFFSGG